MRSLTNIELDRLGLLSENLVSYTLIEPTATALKKGIMDATGIVRSYLKKNEFHNYDLQGQGAKENGVLLDCKIYQEFSVFETQVSLYRPETKKGDPRIWIYKLKKYVDPNDILVLICFDDQLHVFNLTQLNIRKLLTTSIANPLQELFQEVNKSENSISEELLGKLRKIAANGFVPSLVNADTGVGRTLEGLLDIEMNSSKSPDYKGIELKSFREKKGTRKGLFGKTPDWKLSKFKSRIEILDNFGYWEKGIFRLYNTIRATGRNAQGLILRVDYDKEWLLENSDKPDIGDFLVWELKILRQALLKKHKETFWISTESKLINDWEHFLFKEVEHTKNPMIDQFELLIENGNITLDYPIKRTLEGKVIDKGCNFKLKSTALHLLFPPSKKYDLLNY